jgi:YD repeat-containing protein
MRGNRRHGGPYVSEELRDGAISRLLALRGGGDFRSDQVALVAEQLGVSVRTVWGWLKVARTEGRNVRKRRARLEVTEADVIDLAYHRGNVAAFHRARREAGLTPGIDAWRRAFRRGLSPGQRAGLVHGERVRRDYDTTYCYYGETSCGAPAGPAGEVYSTTDPDGYATTYAYDAYGDQTSAKNPVGDVTTTCYNADGWKVASYSPKAGTIGCGTSSSYETTYSYVQANGQIDGFDDVQTVAAPLGETTSYTYDADRNLISTTDADGNKTTYVYDLANEETEVEPASGGDQYTYYTLDGKVLDQKDGNVHAVLTYGYNALNEVTSETDALGKVTSYTYDADGNQLTEQQPGGSCPGTGCTTMTYDADNELTSVTYSSSTTPSVTSITYDSDGQRTGMTDGTGTSSWTWNSLHDLTSYTDGAGAEVQYQDNLDGLVTQITYPGNLSVTEGYNKADQWTSTEDWLGHTFTYAYDADGNLTSTTLPAGTSEVDSAAFNAADQLTSLTDTKSTSTLFSATYGRNGDGELTSDSSEPSTVGSYQYTTVNQLCYAGSANTSACSTPP